MRIARKGNNWWVLRQAHDRTTAWTSRRTPSSGRRLPQRQRTAHTRLARAQCGAAERRHAPRHGLRLVRARTRSTTTGCTSRSTPRRRSSTRQVRNVRSSRSRRSAPRRCSSMCGAAMARDHDPSHDGLPSILGCNVLHHSLPAFRFTTAALITLLTMQHSRRANVDLIL